MKVSSHMNICLFTSVFFNNIGNGFIDIGAETTLDEALPAGINIAKLSQCANFAASMGRAFALKESSIINWMWVHIMQKFARLMHDKTYKAIETSDILSAVKIFDYDYIVIPGCVLTVPFFSIYGKLLKEKSKEGCKIIFLGASGNYYTEHEVKYVQIQLKNLQPYALISRDSVAYNHYKDFAKISYNGIDNAFFVNRANIPELESRQKPYIIVNIEEPRHADYKEKIIEKLKKEHKNIIETNHKPYPYSKITSFAKKDVIISDYPLDYLFLYKNAEAVYSDRVHACIPALSFGNTATLHSDSPRVALFENVGLTSVNQSRLDMEILSSLQNQQIEFLKSIFGE